MQILNDLKVAAGLFADMRKARKRGGAIKVEKKIQIPVIQSGGFYSTVEGVRFPIAKRKLSMLHREPLADFQTAKSTGLHSHRKPENLQRGQHFGKTY